jgi:glycine betaine/choline ABC-type transport system substrate-binding protein
MDRTKIVACLTLAVMAGCSRAPRIVVGSKNFAEQILLGEILAQQIERRLGVAVERKLNLGGTIVAHEALIKGSIDLYPEYTGTAFEAVLKRPRSTDARVVLDAVREAYHSQWQLEWLTPFGFVDTFAMIVRGETARADNLATLSDAARRTWKMGVGYEFKSREDGLDGLLKTYGLKLDGDPVAMDLGLIYAALKGRKVDMVAGNSTDAQIESLGLAVLEDDKHYFPPYECATVVRAATLAKYPQLRAALEELAGKMSDDVMRKLNYEVDGEHRSPAQVAGEYLRTAINQY